MDKKSKTRRNKAADLTPKKDPKGGIIAILIGMLPPSPPPPPPTTK